MKILYIPADNISANFSRSYHIAKSLSNHCDVYKVMWKDNRSAFWEGKRVSTFNGLICFLSSYFQRTRIIKSRDFGYEVYTSVFISAFIGRVIGKYSALKWMRKHNLKTLKKLAIKIQPDVIFHADGYYFFPALNAQIPEFSDLQDDINWNNIPKPNLTEAKSYYTQQFNCSKINFIVSDSAKKSIQEHIKSDFEPISNGAEFKTISAITKEQQEQFKTQHNIPKSHKIASYIGGEHKFDKDFTKSIVKKAEETIPELLFVLAGNLPTFDANNVIFTGTISNEQANILYTISDVGLTLKNTKNNDFIYHSVPLKFIQYAAAKKPIVSFPIKWSVEANFPNITHIQSSDENEWVNAIKKSIQQNNWDSNCDSIWMKYDWQFIGKTIYKKINDTL